MNEQQLTQSTQRPKPTADDGVLVVSADRARREQLVAALDQRFEVEPVASAERAIATATLGGIRLAVVRDDQPSIEVGEIARAFDRLGVGIVVVSPNPSLDDAVQAMQAGVLDIFADETSDQAIAQRVDDAMQRATTSQARQRRIIRLKQLCRQLNTARNQMADEVGNLCSELASAYATLDQQLATMRLSSEFEGVIRQELELESLLRTALEFFLAKFGSLNAAVYLPDQSGDYSLGAYVNYDCPKATAEVMLEQLADVIPSRFERAAGPFRLQSEADLQRALGEGATWLSGQTLLAAPCHEDGECLAVIALFRDRRNAFDEDAVRTFAVLVEAFAAQLARVVRVHHRCAQDEGWGMADEADDGFGLAA
ncbi:MAG: hypothetical protein AAF747_06715 [Planctomycetota bacterium]